MTSARLEIRLLGELTVLRNGAPLPLPASRQTRALFGYLAAVPGAHLRDRLCDLLFDGPDDPRAALRWSLTKLRPLVNGAVLRLRADRDRASFERHDVDLDVAEIERALAGGVDAAPIAALDDVARRLRGEFLDGLDMARSYRFDEWCSGERAHFDALRTRVLSALVARLADDPARALDYARSHAAADPLAEHAHAQIVTLLVRCGRSREAREHFARAKAMLERELGAPITEVLRRAKPAAVPTPAPPVPAPPAAANARPAARLDTPHADVPLLGRAAEEAVLDEQLRNLAARRVADHLMLIGEPGIGKTRLLDALAERARASGLRVLRARAFEAETGRPYGAWIDALRDVAPSDVPAVAQPQLRLLLPGLGTASADEGGRARLFDSIVALLAALAAAAPTLVVLDDLQWLDEASAELLHYVARAFAAPSKLLLACAARDGEVDDNAALVRVWRSLARERRFVELKLGPLDDEATRGLIRSIDPALDAVALGRQSEGHPLFTLQLARMAGAGTAAEGSFTELLAEHLARVEPEARELLACAAAFGREAPPEILGEALGLTPSDLSHALRLLERRGLLHEAAGGGYGFTHDVLRQAMYRSLSQPRRRLLHRQIARALEECASSDDALIGDLAHHASLGANHLLAARACHRAGERCLRLYANAEAVRLVGAGLRHADNLAPGPERARLRLGLLCVHAYGVLGEGRPHDPELANAIVMAIAEGEAARLDTEIAAGYVALSYVHHHAGDSARARDATLQAAEAVLDVDPAIRLRQLANTARCLLDVEADIERSRALMHEVDALAATARASFTELEWGRGLLCRWDGEDERARTLIERALELARAGEERWREYQCLVWLATLDFELGAHARLTGRCADIEAVAARLGNPEAPVAAAFRALAAQMRGEAAAPAELTRAIAALSAIDDKTHLSYLHNEAAALSLATGEVARASTEARAALATARALGRATEIIVAATLCARAAMRAGDRHAALAAVEEAQRAAPAPAQRSARSRRALERMAQEMASPAPTPVPTAVRAT